MRIQRLPRSQIPRNDKLLLEEFRSTEEEKKLSWLINRDILFYSPLQLIGTINSENRMTYRSSACMLIDTAKKPKEKNKSSDHGQVTRCAVPIRFMISSELIS